MVQFASPYLLNNKEEYIKGYKEEIRDVYEDIKISIHGPFVELNTGTRDNLIADVIKIRYNQAYEVAKELKAKKIIFHNGYIPKTYMKEEWMRNNIRFWKEFLEDKLNDIEIHIENLFEEDTELIETLIDEIAHPNFSVCLDIGHANVYSDITPQEWIDRLGSRIKHLHIHNNYGDKDKHRGIGTGEMNIFEIIEEVQKYGQDVSLSLEVLNVEELKDSLKLLKKEGYIK